MANSSHKSSPDLAGALLGSVVAFLAVAIFAWFCVYACFKAVQGDKVVDYRRAGIISSQYLLAHAGLSLPQRRISNWPGVQSWTQLHRYYGRYPILMRAIKTSTWIGTGAGAFSALLLFIALMQPRKREFRIAGTRVLTRPKDAARMLDSAPDGIWLHPEVRISRDLECRHFNILGATGSGKTQVINHMVQSAMSAGDSLLIFDFKGDLTAKFCQAGVALLAPWDSRGWALAVGRDVTTTEHARALAESLIPNSGSDGMWAAAARIVTTAAICACIDRRPGRWTFSDLAGQLTTDEAELSLLVRRFAPEGVRLVEDARSRTTQSIFITIAAHLGPIQSLAMAWADVPEDRTLSIGDWLRTGTPRTIILQGNGEMRPLADALKSMVFRVLLAAVSAPSLPNSNRRRWFFGDEFLQFGKVGELIPLLQVARSKGVRFVLAAQDIPGIRSVYGTDGADAVLSAASTVIITGTNCSVTSEWASKKAGVERLERLEVSRGYSRDGGSDTERWVEVTRPVLTPEDIRARLGQFRRGKKMVTRALIVGARSAVGLLDWPRLELPDIAASYEPATWLSRPGGVVRPEEAPPEAATDNSAHPVPAIEQQSKEVANHTAPGQRRLIIRRKGE